MLRLIKRKVNNNSSNSNISESNDESESLEFRNNEIAKKLENVHIDILNDIKLLSTKQDELELKIDLLKKINEDCMHYSSGIEDELTIRKYF